MAVVKTKVDYLTCPMCDELYKKPKCLPCHHSYCEECLVRLLESSQVSNILVCPECKQTSTIPAGGVQQLPHNFFINRLLDEFVLKRKVEGREEVKCGLCVRKDSAVDVLCLDCGTFLCRCCHENHKYSRKEYQSHSIIPLGELQSKTQSPTIRPKAALCHEHDLELQFYCETCSQLICQYCIMKDHLEHHHETVKEAVTKHRKELDKIMKAVEAKIEQLSTSHKKISNVRDKTEAQADVINKEIDNHYEEICKRLWQQRDELKKEVREAYTQKKREVTVQLQQVEHTQAKLESIKELNGVMKYGSDQETLLMKKKLVDDVKRLHDDYNKLVTQPIQLTTMEFIPVEQYKKSLPKFGSLFDGACSHTSEILNVPQWVFEGDCVQFKLITRDRDNHCCNKGGNTIVIHVQSSREDVIPVEVKDNKDGSYSASFVANQVGEVELSVTIKGQNLKDSPFSIMVRGKYTTIIKPNKIINNIGKKGTPWGIAFGRNGMWAVTDRYNHCVRTFDRQGKMIQIFGGNGAEKGKFNSPSGIAFDSNNHVYVTDSWNNRVQKFTVTGTHLLLFGSYGSGNGQLNNPLGILVHNRQVYVVENSGNRISAFQLDGQFSHIIGSGYLKSPYYVAVNTDQLLVADCGHHCISMFTLDGNYVGKFGARGTGSGQLKNPTGVATYMYGFILVTEENNRVSIFDKDGRFLHSFGSKGTGNGQFLLPRGIAISPVGDIYICDSNNERIQIF